MKFKLLLPLILLSSFISAQSIQYAYDSKDMKTLLAGKLYLVLTGDSAFDDTLKMDIKKYWTMTPVEVISKGDLSTAMKDGSKFFIACLDEKNDNFTFASPMQGHKVESHLVKVDPNITATKIYIFRGAKNGLLNGNIVSSCGFPLGNRHYANRCLEYVIKNLNDNFKVVIDNKLDPIKHAAGISNPAVREDFCTNTQVLKDRTLLIPEDLQKYVLKEKALKDYKYKYAFISEAALFDSIKANSNTFCFVPTDCTGDFDIFDPVTKSKIYCGTSSGSSGYYIGDKQVGVLVKAINGEGAKKKK